MTKILSAGQPLKNNQGNRAFTFLELLVALTLGTVILTLCWPFLQSTQKKYRLTQFVKTMNHQLTYARQKAVDTHSDLRLVFDFKEQMIVLQTYNPENADIAVDKTLDHLSIPRGLELPSDDDSMAISNLVLPIFADGSIENQRFDVTYNSAPLTLIVDGEKGCSYAESV